MIAPILAMPKLTDVTQHVVTGTRGEFNKNRSAGSEEEPKEK